MIFDAGTTVVELFPIRYRTQQCILGLARVKARVLHDDGYVGFDDAGEVRFLWNLLRLGQVVEPDVFCAARGNRDRVGAGRLSVREKDSDFDVRVLV